jgi:hypothetical protein
MPPTNLYSANSFGYLVEPLELLLRTCLQICHLPRHWEGDGGREERSSGGRDGGGIERKGENEKQRERERERERERDRKCVCVCV